MLVLMVPTGEAGQAFPIRTVPKDHSTSVSSGQFEPGADKGKPAQREQNGNRGPLPFLPGEWD